MSALPRPARGPFEQIGARVEITQDALDEARFDPRRIDGGLDCGRAAAGPGPRRARGRAI